MAGTQTSGTSENGYTIFASGTDENGNAVSGYILGRGSVEIMEADGTLSPDRAQYYVHLLSAQSETPREGDMYPTPDGYAIWQNGEAHALGATLTDEQISAIDSVVDERRTYVSLGDGTISAYNWIGEVDDQTLIAAGLLDETMEHYADIRSIRFGEGVTEIARRTFAYCETLTAATIPESLSACGDNVFRGCSSLVDIYIPDGTTQIASGTFRECSILERLRLPEGLTAIGASVFQKCLALWDIDIPSTVESIGDGAFLSSAIRELTIPEKCAAIGANAFANCSQLSRLVFRGKSLAEISAMQNYPFGLSEDQISAIVPFREASEDWAEENFYQKSETSSAVEISVALSAKVDLSAYNATLGNLSAIIHNL